MYCKELRLFYLVHMRLASIEKMTFFCHQRVTFASINKLWNDQLQNLIDFFTDKKR